MCLFARAWTALQSFKHFFFLKKAELQGRSYLSFLLALPETPSLLTREMFSPEIGESSSLTGFHATYGLHAYLHYFLSFINLHIVKFAAGTLLLKSIFHHRREMVSNKCDAVRQNMSWVGENLNCDNYATLLVVFLTHSLALFPRSKWTDQKRTSMWLLIDCLLVKYRDDVFIFDRQLNAEQYKLLSNNFRFL